MDFHLMYICFSSLSFWTSFRLKSIFAWYLNDCTSLFLGSMCLEYIFHAFTQIWCLSWEVWCVPWMQQKGGDITSIWLFLCLFQWYPDVCIWNDCHSRYWYLAWDHWVHFPFLGFCCISRSWVCNSCRFPVRNYPMSLSGVTTGDPSQSLFLGLRSSHTEIKMG